MKLFKKAISIFVATALAATNGILVSADTQTVTYDSTVNDSASSYSSVEVEAERAELYTVTLPKSVTLGVENTSAEYNYEVSVTGEIGEGNYVRVIPLANATLTNQKSGSELPLKVEQEKRRFAYDEINLTTAATADGTYSAENMQPGEYSGNVRYLITLDDGATWTSASCTTPSTRIGQDLNDNGVIDLGEDLDGDGNLDVDEDANSNGVLDAGEDIDGDGHLDVDEDTNGDGVLAISEKDSDLGLNVTRGTALGHLYPENRSFECICERCSSTCFAIATPEHLIEFANEVNGGKTYSNATVYLCNDLDLTGYAVPNIGYGNASFRGTFDGCNYKIYNYSHVRTYSDNSITNVGFFAEAEAESIKNLTFINPTVHCSVETGYTTSFRAGILAGTVNAADVEISNVHIYNGTLTIDGQADGDSQAKTGRLFLGGLVGSVEKETTLENCSFTGAVNNLSTGWFMGYYSGLASLSCSALVANNCMVAAKIMSNQYDNIQAVSTGWSTVSCTATNVVVDTTLCTSNYGTGMTTDQMKSQSALDVLNTDNELTWKLDMEGLNNGYPIIA